MDKIVSFVFSVSLSYLFAFPILLVILKLDSPKKLEFRGRKVVASLLSIIIVAIFSFVNLLLSEGEVALYFNMFWFLILIPAAIGFYILIEGICNKGENEENTGKKRIFGFKYLTAISLALSVIVAFSLVSYFTSIGGKTVLNFHQELVNEIISSKDPMEVLNDKTAQPSYMLDDFVNDIELIKAGNTDITYALPWRVELFVQMPDKSASWVIDYVRYRNEWCLEGPHTITGISKSPAITGSH